MVSGSSSPDKSQTLLCLPALSAILRRVPERLHSVWSIGRKFGVIVRTVRFVPARAGERPALLKLQEFFPVGPSRPIPVQGVKLNSTEAALTQIFKNA